MPEARSPARGALAVALLLALGSLPWPTPTPIPAGPPAGLAGPPRLLFDLPLDPNLAAPATLQALPGIGPVRAAAIAVERVRRPFCSVAELVRVPGIGPVTLARVSPWLRVEPAACRNPVREHEPSCSGYPQRRPGLLLGGR